MAELARIVSVLPDGAMNHNVLRRVIELLGREIEARGIAHVTLDGCAAGFPQDLLRHVTDPATGVYLGHRYYDLRLVHSESQGLARRSLFEALDRPVFATIQDHPFSNFMWSRMEHASRTTHFVCPTLEFESEARFINPRLTHFHKGSPTLTEPMPPAADIRPLAERPIDIFMPCAFYSTQPGMGELHQRFLRDRSPMAKVIDAVYETGMTTRDRPVMQLFLEAYRHFFGEDLVLATPMSRDDCRKVEVLSCLDNRIRLDRRIKVLRSLARLDLPLKIVTTLDPEDRKRIPEVENNRNVEVIGRIDSLQARRLFLDAKFAINVMPTYVSFVTERVVNAMALGCCVISDRNRHFAETFEAGREILFLDDCEAGGLARYFDTDLAAAQDIAGRGRDKALTGFAVGNYADDLIAVMRKVL